MLWAVAVIRVVSAVSNYTIVDRPRVATRGLALGATGWALELAGRSEEAAYHLEAAYTKLPDETEVLLHWAVNLRSRGWHEEARRALQRVVLRAPDSASAGRARNILGSSP